MNHQSFLWRVAGSQFPSWTEGQRTNIRQLSHAAKGTPVPASPSAANFQDLTPAAIDDDGGGRGSTIGDNHGTSVPDAGGRQRHKKAGSLEYGLRHHRLLPHFSACGIVVRDLVPVDHEHRGELGNRNKRSATGCVLPSQRRRSWVHPNIARDGIPPRLRVQCRGVRREVDGGCRRLRTGAVLVSV